jgi:uncharacterized protein
VLAALLPFPVLLMMQVVLIVPLVLYALVSGDRTPEAIQNRILAVSLTVPVFLLLTILAQGVLCAIAAVGALLSKESLVQRLRLRRPSMPLFTWLLLPPATLAAAYSGEALARRFFSDPGESMKLIVETLLESSGVLRLILVVVISLLPGLFEELLYRGYVQSRLLRRWPSLMAIGFTSVVFAAVHMDPAHVIGVIPLAFWLGFVAWRSDSTWPSMICHALNNLIACIYVFYVGEQVDQDPEQTAMMATDAEHWMRPLLVASFFCLAAAIAVLLKFGHPADRFAQGPA